MEHVFDSQTFVSDADEEQRRPLWRILVAIVAIAAFFGLSVAPAAVAATGTVSNITLSIAADGTAPFDADNAPGNDSSGANGIVRTSDFVTYRWDYSVSVSGDITFTQTLPAGLKWDTASTTNCSQGAAAIAGQVLTCTVLNAPAGAGSYSVKAKVLGAANGAALSTSVTATTGGATSATVPVTISASPPQTILDFASGQAAFGAAGPGSFSGVRGINTTDRVNLYMPIDPTKGVVGLGSLAVPITFTVDLPANAAGGVLRSCTNGPASATADPQIAGNVLSCVQPGGPGTPVTVTITATNSTLDTWPTKTQSGASLPTGRAYFFAGTLSVWYPLSSFPENSTTTITELATGFDPNGVDGSSNFGAGYSPNQQPGATCVAVSPGNCASVIVNTNPTYIRANQLVGVDRATVVPGGVSINDGQSPLYPGTKYYESQVVLAGAANADADNMRQCMVWDNSISNIDPSRPTYLGASPIIADAEWVLEYGTAAYANDTARLNADCGSAGDGAANWYASIAAVPGGAESITGVRIRMLRPWKAGESTNLWVSLERSATPVADGTAIRHFTNWNADGIATSRQDAVGNRGVASTAAVRNTVAWGAATGSPGDVRQVTVSPTVTSPNGLLGAVTENVQVSVTLPNSCMSFQTGSASLTPSSVTPTTPASCADGVGGPGQVVVFDLGPWPVNTPVPPITFNTVLNPLMVIPATAVVSSTIASTSDRAQAASGARTATATMPVNALATFAVTKTASTSVVSPGVPFTYTLGWANRLATTVGTASFVDVLPYNGDARGTTGLNGLTVDSVTPSTPAVSVWYTSDPSAQVAAAVTGDPSGMTGIAWSQTKPATVTAVQFRTDELTPGKVQSAEITVTAGGLSRSGSMSNDVWGKATALDAPVQGAAKVTVTSDAAELSGNVYTDVDYSFSKTSGDTPVVSPTVRITTGYAFGPDGIDNGGAGDDVALVVPITADSLPNGDYVFPGVAPGKYSVEVTPPAGTRVVVSPVMPITLGAAATVTGRDFGVQTLIPVPVANPDEDTTGQGAPVTIPVLDNDTADASATVTNVSVTAQAGVVTISPDGKTVSYTPAAGFTGEDTFTYTITDKARQTATATVTVTVVAGPQAVADSVTTGQGIPATVAVLDNDTGADLTVTAVGTSPNGTATINPDQTVTFTPNATFAGTATISYTVTDRFGVTDAATVSVIVVAAPVATDDEATSKQDTASIIPVLVNDVGTGLAVTSVGTSPNGTAVINPNGTVTFTPITGFSGDATFTYTVTDNANQTVTATVTVHVIGTPVANPDTAMTAFNTPVVIPVLGNDTGTTLEVSQVGTSPNGTATINPDGTVTFTPTTGFSGTATFGYTVTDGVGQTASSTVSVIVRPVPGAVDDTIMIREGATATLDVLDNDTGTGLSVTSLGSSPDGTATINPDGTVMFTPNTGFTGTATFTYTETDDVSQTSTATVTVIVLAVPTAEDDSGTTGQGVAITIPVLANDSGTSLDVTAGSSTDGTVTVNPDRSITFTPNASFAGEADFTYSVTDPLGQTATATVTVTVIGMPTAGTTTARTGEEMPVVVDVLPFVRGTSVDVTSVSSPDGTATLNEDGTITFTANPGFSGVATVTYTVTDAIGQTATSTIAVTVVARPIAAPDSVRTPMDTPITINALDNDTGENLRIVSVGTSPYGTAVLNPDGTITFTPNPGYHDDPIITYTIEDDLGQSATGEITIFVESPPAPEPTPTPTPNPAPAPTPDAGGNGLAHTGSDSTALPGGLAALALLLGSATLILRRRGRTNN